MSNVKLLLIGSCRNAEDEKRVQELRKLCDELKITNYVDFKLNVSFDELKQNLANSAVGLHSMKEEHFGIGEIYNHVSVCRFSIFNFLNLKALLNAWQLVQ